MAGTKLGAQKAALTNKIRHGEDFFRRIGQSGGKNGSGGGWAWMAKNDPQRLSELGSKGGTISRRKQSVTEVQR